MLWPERSVDLPLTNGELFALPSMAPVRAALDAEFNRYIAKHRVSLPNDTVGVGESFAFQLFDRAQLYSADTRLVLAGIVNRVDRAYVDAASCGEIRLIYRLARTAAAPTGDNAASPRLPMTLNLVLKAKGDRAMDRDGKPITCADIARRWLAISELSLTGRNWRTDCSAWMGLSISIDYRKHRPHRDQSADRACAEIGGPRFPHRLSPEGVRLRPGSAPLRGSAAREPDRPRPDPGRRQSQARVQGVAAGRISASSIVEPS